MKSSIGEPAVDGYIKEIDGLRAVAVLAVLIFHAGFGKLGGGFVGVDVFFVISGYLITGILTSSNQFKVEDLKRFYFRRIVRIAPALFTVLLFTILLFFIISPPVRAKSFTPSALSAVFSYSNFWFYATIDYFSDNSKNPFLHTWSLAVEEQFYLCLPLLVWLLRGQRAKHRGLSFTVLFIVSFTASVLSVKGNQAGAFYFPWLRAWELLAGSLLAVAPLEKIKPMWKSLSSNLGLAAIIAASVLYTEKTLFPGLSALVPVLGATGVIAGAGTRSIANIFLCAKPVRWVGKISYSLYLVHWPIICAAALLTNLLLSATKIFIVLASFLFAWISWRFVETPTRRLVNAARPKQVFMGFGLACICSVPLTFAVQSAGAALWHQSPLALGYTNYLKADPSLFRNGTCLLTPLTPDLNRFQDSCLEMHDKMPGVLVLGDSHAANIVAAMAEQHTSMSILQATAVGCKPVLGTTGPAYCTGLMQRMLLEWLPRSGASVPYVVIAARWVDADIGPLKNTVAHLKSLGKQVIVYGPSPEYTMAVPMILAYEEILGLTLGDRLVVTDRFRLDKVLESSFTAGARYFSPISNLCSQGQCVILEQGIPLLSDGDHLTRNGARKALRNFPIP